MVRCRRKSSHENSYRVVSFRSCCRGDVVIVSMRRPPRCLRLTMQSNSTSRSPVSLAAICRLGTTQPRQPVHTVVTLTRGNPNNIAAAFRHHAPSTATTRSSPVTRRWRGPVWPVTRSSGRRVAVSCRGCHWPSALGRIRSAGAVRALSRPFVDDGSDLTVDPL